MRRIIGSALKAGVLSALRNLTKSNRSGSSPASSRTTRRTTTSRTTTSRTTTSGRATKPSSSSSTRSSQRTRSSQPPRSGQPTQVEDLNDYSGTPVMEYRPRDDGKPDPGEIVWAWVPYEENDGRGKDRPVLIIGHDRSDLLGLMLTSKDHDRDAQQEARDGRFWTDIGAGDWDAQRRPSEVRLDRVLRIEASAVRREGAVLSKAKFDHVAAEVGRVHTLRRG